MQVDEHERSLPAESGRRPPRSTRRSVIVAAVLYGALALAAYLPVWPGQRSQVPWCACDDTAQSIWFLRWTPFALSHGHSLLTSSWIDVPTGVNLARNTSMPLLGLLAAPLTLTRGPAASFTFLLWLGIASSGTACFVVLRQWVSWSPAAFVGGLLYAFSSYIAGQGLGHLNLVFIPLPPIMVYVLYELVVRQRGSARRWGIALGLLAAAQFLISPELLIDAAVMAVLGLALLMLARPGEVAARLRHGVAGLGWALLAALPFVAYPIVVFLGGPERFTGSPWRGATYSMDVLSSIVPTLNQRVTTTGLAAFGDRLQPNLAENGGYIGIPLLVLLVVLVVRYRHIGLLRFSAAMAVVAWVLSLGPRLNVDGHHTVVRLPFAVFLHLPILDSILAGRFTLFIDLFVAFVVALGVDRLRADLAGRPHLTGRAVVLAVGALVVVALLPLVPRWPYPHVPVSTTTPTFFQTADVDAVPAGSAALTYPYAVYPENQSMLWQALSAMRFKILGGYALIPGPDQLAIDGPGPVEPAAVPDTLISDYDGQPNPGPAATPGQLRTLVRRYDIRSLMVGPGGVDPAAAITLFTQAYGPPAQVGGLLLWTHLH